MDRNDILEHIGTPHVGATPHSGRYKWGSGENSLQRAVKFQDIVTKYRKSGLSDTEIAGKLGMTTTEFRNRASIAKREVMEDKIRSVTNLKDKGMTPSEISKMTDIPEPTVRMYLNNQVKDNIKKAKALNDDLEALVKKYDIIDVGRGSAEQLGVTEYSLRRAIGELTQDGTPYFLHEVYVPNMMTEDEGKFVRVKTLSKYEDIEDVKSRKGNIQPPLLYKNENGETVLGLKPIKSIKMDRIKIKYDEEGGGDMDGVIMLRPGVKDLDLGSSKYAQVRISAGPKDGELGTHFLKGMAVYGDPKDFPKGTDIIFNTNKKKGTPKEDVLKPLKKDPKGKIDIDNPFGATIKPNGQKGAINKVNEEGDWNDWGRTLSAQFLSKQPPSLVKEQIAKTYSKYQKEFDEINRLTNPVVKKKMLEEFADGLDAKRYSLKLKGIEGMRSQVLLPVPGMKANEIYAPNFKDGEKVVLVRYPHGGTFEIPELTVNNKYGNTKAKFMKGAKDAVGIDSSVASKLSGADFDGDTVTVIPNSNRKGTKVKSSPSLPGLRNFDPKQYQVNHETITNATKQKEMGIVSNLITDMTLKKAPLHEIERAVKHSMVVIDSEKHKLDWKRSAIDNNIDALHTKYQTHIDVLDGKKKRGASTLISRSKTEHKVSETVIKKRTKEELEANPRLKPEYKISVTKSMGQQMDLVKDAKKLGSGTAIENMYGDYANNLSSLGKKARNILEKTPDLQYSPEAKKKYSKEVESLNRKLNEAVSNAPRERQAQLKAHKTYVEKYDPRWEDDDKIKYKRQALNAARASTGAKQISLDITEKEWTAIQAGAISTNKLKGILYYANSDQVKKLATPKDTNRRSSITTSQVTRARSMINKGYSYAEVSRALGISIDTIQDNI